MFVYAVAIVQERNVWLSLLKQSLKLLLFWKMYNDDNFYEGKCDMM